MNLPSGQTILSGIQPSGVLHLGNYLGAIKQWVALQDNNTAYYCIVDEHAITVPYDKEKLPEYILDTAATYLAAGLDPTKSTVFVQSHVPAHTELAWLLGTLTPLGELKRMTQFKEKENKQQAESNLGLFAYPVLQAADILLYQADLVPVGEDQTQHIELTRDIAKRFNNKFGESFTIPKAYLPEGTSRIMSLSDPTAKMSKSDLDKSYIALTDEPDAIRQKIKSAVTETEPVISFTKSGPAVQNLLQIYEAFSQLSRPAIEEKLSTGGHQKLKESLADIIIEHLQPLQEKYADLRSDETALKKVLAAGAAKANEVASKTLHLVKEKMGLA
ncbi:tryptophan--tRNA ligase [Patescibacteria group bacterium]|nr:tryptophan--tRNA ligase [Patescibacteria group bacterium]